MGVRSKSPTQSPAPLEQPSPKRRATHTWRKNAQDSSVLLVKDAERTRAEIIAVATEEFSTYGYSGGRINEIAERTRTNKVSPDELSGGTFTLTNTGSRGALFDTPIINQPQVAILATGAIKKKPVVIESDKGDSIAIRHMMFVSMSYDHRIIDGGMGSLFLAAFVEALESFDVNRTF